MQRWTWVLQAWGAGELLPDSKVDGTTLGSGQLWMHLSPGNSRGSNKEEQAAGVPCWGSGTWAVHPHSSSWVPLIQHFSWKLTAVHTSVQPLGS